MCYSYVKDSIHIIKKTVTTKELTKVSDFHELIKNFSKTRGYVRDFFVYGFKTRNEFKEKSPRTYDNERRRLECWLSPYVRRDYTQSGTNISLAIDSNLLDTNPLFQVWKTKSFTDNDIVLHFLLLDLLKNSRPLTAEEITDCLLSKYDALFDIQTVRRKCNSYAAEGLLNKVREGKTVVFSLDTSLAAWIKVNEAVLDACTFYQMAEAFGIIGNYITGQYDYPNRVFRVKHSFFVHTLEDEILLVLLNAMNDKRSVRLEMKSSRRGTVNTSCCVPLRVFVSTRSGRRFLCGYLMKSRRFTCFRLDTIRRVILEKETPKYSGLLEMLNRNQHCLWGVSFHSESGHHLEKLTMTLQAIEPEEDYIIDRLKREGRGGTVTKLAPDTYMYETEVFDCNEMLPWIRTFTGRILSLTCTDKLVEQRFYQDLQTMYHIYHL